MKQIKQTLVGISPTHIKARLSNVAIALLFAAAIATCSVTIWASPSGHGTALDTAQTQPMDPAFGAGDDPTDPLGQDPAPVTILPPFDVDYSSVMVGSVPGVPVPYGGLAFKYDDPNTLLVAGGAGNSGGRIYQIPVNRDGNGHKIGRAHV